MRSALAARSLSALTGESFFRALVVNLAAALRAEHVFAAELLPGGRRLRSLALQIDGVLRDPVECDLEGTPWENLIAGSSAGWPAAVQKLFCRDPLLTELGAHALVGTPLQDSAGGRIGLLAALYRTPQAELGPARALLEIFAARAGAELERQQVERGLRGARGAARARAVGHGPRALGLAHRRGRGHLRRAVRDDARLPGGRGAARDARVGALHPR